jgi:hypothetical protein
LLWKNNRDLLRIFNRAPVPSGQAFWKSLSEVLRDRIFNRASVPKKIRFFGKIGFLTVHQRPKKSDFLEKSDF